MVAEVCILQRVPPCVLPLSSARRGSLPSRGNSAADDLPWGFESAVRAATLLGLARRPGLLFRRAR
jgi:hypothetical protein